MQGLFTTGFVLLGSLVMGCSKNDPQPPQPSESAKATVDDSFPAGLDFAGEEIAEGRYRRYAGYHLVHARVPTREERVHYDAALAYGGGMDIFRRVESPSPKRRKEFLRQFFGRPPIDVTQSLAKSWSYLPSYRGYLLTMSRTRSAPPELKVSTLIFVTELGDIWVIPKGSAHPAHIDAEAREFLSTGNAPPVFTLTYRIEAEFNRQQDAAPK